MNAIFTLLKSVVASWVLSHPAVLETFMNYPALANTVLTPARVVVLVSDQSFRKR
ncbi:MAG: hypothetical protein H2174_07180 [Vampirovibrio sp.]|jgi:hypothetical protein|nr:hypothetical protein [Vampirovibrio sp.]